MSLNKYGLSRDIPEPVKRIVRQNCGFGCVICGSSIIEYEHVEPDFSESRVHDPNHITLLCPQCHSKVTTGFWSKEKVKEAMLNPRSKQLGYSNEIFDFGVTHPAIIFGGATLTCCQIPIEVRGQPLFKIEEPEVEKAPFRLTGFFLDSKGNPSLKIINNEWFANSSNWDVEASGGAIIIREGKGKISLKIVAKPPKGLIIEKLDMHLYGIQFIADENILTVKYPGGAAMSFQGCLFSDSRVGMSF